MYAANRSGTFYFRRLDNPTAFFYAFFHAAMTANPGKVPGQPTKKYNFGGLIMDFFNSAVDVLQTLVIALGAGLCLWGGINLLEGYGQDNRATRS